MTLASAAPPAEGTSRWRAPAFAIAGVAALGIAGFVALHSSGAPKPELTHLAEAQPAPTPAELASAIPMPEVIPAAPSASAAAPASSSAAPVSSAHTSPAAASVPHPAVSTKGPRPHKQKRKRRLWHARLNR